MTSVQCMYCFISGYSFKFILNILNFNKVNNQNVTVYVVGPKSTKNVLVNKPLGRVGLSTSLSVVTFVVLS